MSYNLQWLFFYFIVGKNTFWYNKKMKKIKSKAKCRKEYQEKFELFQKLLEVAKGDIGELLDQNSIDTISTLGRVKKFDSYYKKASIGMEESIFTNPIDEIQDIVGIRSILIFIDDLEKISSILSPVFKILKVERKGSINPENTFGYESDHYIIQYKNVLGPRYKNLMDLKFELQVRTALMDAWASLSHKIDYKTDAAMPSELKKVFFGLNGMFVVADKTFQDLKNSSKINQEKLSKQITIEKLFDQEINLDTLKAYVDLKFKGKAYNETDDGGYSDFIEEIKKLERYNSIKDVEDAVQSAFPFVIKIEKKLGGNVLQIIGLLRAIFDLYDDKYFERLDNFQDLEWTKAIKEGRKLMKIKGKNLK